MSSLAQEESRSISENVTWGQRKRMADGKVTMPYGRFLGYRKGEDGLPEIVPEEAEVVRLIYKSFMKGLSYYKIAKMLMERDIPAPGGGEKWHSTSKYKRTIWQCNHKFMNGEKCTTPHLYEDEIKKRFIEVCNRIATDKDDFLISCQQIVEMLSNTAALDKKIEAQYIYLNGLAVSMQEFIKENAMKPQDEDFYKKKMAEYNVQKAEAEKVLHDLQDKRTARLSRKELLEELIRTLSNEGIVTDTFDGKLWLLLVEKATVGTDGKLTFTLRNGMEIEV